MSEKLFTRNFICLVAANFLLYFGFWMLTPVLPFYLYENFSCSEAAIGSILSCYTLSALCVRPFMGYVYDGFSRKPIYVCAYFLFTAVFLGYILTSLLAVFVMLRIVHGLAFGTVTVGGNTLVIDVTPSSRRGEAIGYYGLANNVAMSIGPMTGLFLHDARLGYSNIFTLGMLTCLIGFLAALTVKTKPRATVKRPPISLDRFILLKGIPAGIALMLLSIPYAATTNYVAVYAREIELNVPTGFFFTLMAIGMGVSRITAGKYVDRGRITQTISYGFYVIITAFFLLYLCAHIITHSVGWCTLVFYLVPFMLGAGFGTMFPAYNTLYVNLAPNNQRATATSTYLTSWDVGLGLGIASGGYIAHFFNWSTVYLFGSVLCIVSMLFFNLYVTPHFQHNRVR